MNHTQSHSRSNHVGPNPIEIKKLFSSISKHYDLANDVMTMKLVHSWRRKVVAWSGAKYASTVLDCATGTGDLAFEFKRVVTSKGQVIGTDFCQSMLDIGQKKAKKLDLHVDFQIADATHLPFDDNTFHITSIAYGIRNVIDPIMALTEMARVTKPGGTVMILETGEVQTPIVGPALRVYIKHMIPLVGGFVSGNRAAYEYLNNSSSQFPCQNNFLKMMETTKAFQSMQFKTLLGGASYIYKGIANS